MPTQKKVGAEESSEKKNKNPFEALAETDSEEEGGSAATAATAATATAAPVPASPPFRSWNLEESSGRFKGDDVKGNIFSSPFQKSKKQTGGQNPYVSKHWMKPRFKEDDEGWTSIQYGSEKDYTPVSPEFGPYTPPKTAEEGPKTPPDEEMEPIALPEIPPQNFPSLLTRGTGTAVILEETIASGNKAETLSALAWAERIKKSLEKAEQQKVAGALAAEEPAGRLSFFRKAPDA